MDEAGADRLGLALTLEHSSQCRPVVRVIPIGTAKSVAPRGPSSSNSLAISMSVGMSIGLALGVAMSNIALGFALGITFGTGVGAALEAAEKRRTKPKD
jgi:hypothetical protein